MCGRYSITLPPEAIREIFQTYGELPNWPAYYNAPPTTALPVVRQGLRLNTGPVSKAEQRARSCSPKVREPNATLLIA